MIKNKVFLLDEFKEDEIDTIITYRESKEK